MKGDDIDEAQVASHGASSGSESSNSVKERATWGRTAEFFLSTVGYCVGLGNLWRFPYLCYRNGGGVFLIPYTIFLFLCGIPLVFLEMSIGQFSSSGPLKLWSVCPLAKGLGISMVIVSIYCCVYYNVIIMWTLYYLGHSFYGTLPWAECKEEWGECNQFGDEEPLNVSLPFCSKNMKMESNISWYNNSYSLWSDALGCRPQRPPYPAELFWDKHMLSRSGGISDLGVLRWDLAITLFTAWLLVFLCLFKGIKSSGKVVYVTATLPYILLTILLIQNATMEGSIDGVEFYMKPNFSMLAEPKVWAEACDQIFFSLGAAWGGIITMASYNKFNSNVYRFAIVVPLINCATSIYAGFVIFCVLGAMAHEAGLPVSEIADSGPGLLFVAYPYAISNLPVPQLWAVLFFIMVLTVGVDSQFGMFETFTTCVFDELPHIFKNHKRKMVFTAALCLSSFLVGLLFCTQAGIYFFQLMDWYIGIFTLLSVSCMECLIFSWVYGADRLYKDIQLMIGYTPIIIWKYMWKFVTPFFIAVMLIYSLVTYKAPIYKKVILYPPAAIGLAWLYGISSALPVPIYAAYLLWKTRAEDLSVWERVKKYMKPSSEWASRSYQQYSDSLAGDDALPLNAAANDDLAEKQPLNSEDETTKLA